MPKPKEQDRGFDLQTFSRDLQKRFMEHFPDRIAHDENGQLNFGEFNLTNFLYF